MLPSFFDSVLQLIVRTSTDLPPDVRAAMKHALVAEPQATRSSQALTIIAQNIDLAADADADSARTAALALCLPDRVENALLHALESAVSPPEVREFDRE